MIFIAVKFTVRPEKSDQWLSLTEPFTLATRAEPGNIFFEWSRSADDPNQFVLLEAFAGQEAGVAHVQSDHFKEAIELMSGLVASTPEIINVETEGTGWGEMAEVKPREH